VFSFSWECREARQHSGRKRNTCWKISKLLSEDNNMLSDSAIVIVIWLSTVDGCTMPILKDNNMYSNNFCRYLISIHNNNILHFPFIPVDFLRMDESKFLVKNPHATFPSIHGNLIIDWTSALPHVCYCSTNQILIYVCWIL
jgi:hypothetical protein